ncbi:DHA2 family efflux MFS transporter permease subunit [Catenulispora sp. NF23]|uniref:DHA2 family efflux MFS transporter permease subunit n=1 Tax=Catenulispora pinistramenti TaxID=2705254 RepID=A0ABS5KUV5_9ACTN|nr:DHA2 family efflux MFS transporter permease subunit [Catenulispora pinistramenti]MBS2537380.1 DHA2 family efflux MFS transporter permease subunit [Catenulispora pinistramenti]MBS2549841.1 DHA2 family efflux MFS transporter permease subunit [Catenulispora pinistramenti]
MNPQPSGDRLPREYLKIGFALVLGAAMAMLDATVVAVATRTLAERFGSPLSAVAWVSTAYLLTMSVVVPLAGWAMGRFGGRRVWLLSVTAFLVGSVLCGAAWSIPSLIAFRVLQALGGGLIQPVGQALLGRNVGPRHMARVMAVMSVPMALLPVLGPAVGGLLLAEWGWRWIFFINVPIGVAGIVLVRRWVPVSVGGAGSAGPAGNAARFDIRGFALISPGLAALVYGCSAAGDHGGFSSPAAWGPVLGGLLLVTVFVLYSLRTKIQPLVDLRLFRDRAFAVAMLNAALMGATLFGAMFLLPLYFQQAHGFSALRAGLTLAPQGLGTAISTFAAGRMTNRTGPRVLVMTGTAVATAATLPFAMVGAGTSTAALMAPLFLRGLGLGLVMAPLIAAGYSTLRRESIPQATTTFNILNRVGGSIGTAVLAVILVRGLADRAATPAHVASAYSATFWWALACTAVTLVTAAFLPGAKAMRAALAAAAVHQSADAAGPERKPVTAAA